MRKLLLSVTIGAEKMVLLYATGYAIGSGLHPYEVEIREVPKELQPIRSQGNANEMIVAFCEAVDGGAGSIEVFKRLAAQAEGDDLTGCFL
jgi:hypothetical protein